MSPTCQGSLSGRVAARTVLGLALAMVGCGGEMGDGTGNLEAYDTGRPPAGYEARSAAGFSIFVHQAVLAHPAEARAVLASVAASLAELKALLGEARAQRLANVRVWIEWEAKDLDRRPRGSAEFHPSREWLAANGYDVAKEHGVEINDTRNFLASTTTREPLALVHEMAHAYDFLVLLQRDAGLDAAFEQARSSRRYDSVARINGTTGRAYAMTNTREYFAETTEAFLGVNDFYPHTREQLRLIDPPGYALMERIWGAPAARPAGSIGPCTSGLRSAPGALATAVVLTNRSARTLEIAWLDTLGQPSSRGRLAPNASSTQITFQGHVFSVSDTATGACLGTFGGQARPTEVVFTR